MFGIFKKKKAAPVKETKSYTPPQNTNVNSFGEPLDKLVDGDLPWGWVAANKEFIDSVQKEHGHFQNLWYEVREKGNSKEEIAALKSYLLYADDIQKMCDKKGECFSFWCKEYLVGSNKTYYQEKLTDLERK